MNILIAHSNYNQLAKWINKNYDPEDNYTFLDIEHIDDVLGLRFDRVVLLDIVIHDKDSKELVEFLLSRQSLRIETSIGLDKQLSLGDTPSCGNTTEASSVTGYNIGLPISHKIYRKNAHLTCPYLDDNVVEYVRVCSILKGWVHFIDHTGADKYMSCDNFELCFTHQYACINLSKVLQHFIKN